MGRAIAWVFECDNCEQEMRVSERDCGDGAEVVCGHCGRKSIVLVDEEEGARVELDGAPDDDEDDDVLTLGDLFKVDASAVKCGKPFLVHDVWCECHLSALHDGACAGYSTGRT